MFNKGVYMSWIALKQTVKSHEAPRQHTNATMPPTVSARRSGGFVICLTYFHTRKTWLFISTRKKQARKEKS